MNLAVGAAKSDGCLRMRHRGRDLVIASAPIFEEAELDAREEHLRLAVGRIEFDGATCEGEHPRSIVAASRVEGLLESKKRAVLGESGRARESAVIRREQVLEVRLVQLACRSHLVTDLG